ncbi:DUF4382 domain-containing protein [Candidatus Nanohaloarchaea archaeon]|nr:DUF4382 domain-containing protein [Candidatus Nanohaloarchaea archaeon]
MKRIHALALLAAVITVSGCTSTTQSNTGQFELLVSDRPADIDKFDYLNVGFSHARIFVSNNSTVEVKQISLENTSMVDLTQLQNESAESLVNTTLEAGNYSKIELYTETVNASVNGSSVEVKVPPGKLMITKPFTVRPNETTSFVFDIQVVLRGNQQNNQGYILKPVISESGVVGKDIEVDRKSTQAGNQAQQPPTNTTPQGNQGPPQRRP